MYCLKDLHIPSIFEKVGKMLVPSLIPNLALHRLQLFWDQLRYVCCADAVMLPTILVPFLVVLLNESHIKSLKQRNKYKKINKNK